MRADPRFALGESTIGETSFLLRALAARYGVPELARVSTGEGYPRACQQAVRDQDELWFRVSPARDRPRSVRGHPVQCVRGTTVDFGSRDLPTELVVVNAVPNPELTFDEGRAVVSSELPEIGLSARVYYTSGDGDEQLLSITDSGVVVYGEANHGD
jgi:hypothetical protein